jgi:hypothetical protein
VDYTYPKILLNGVGSTLGPSVLGIYENSTTPVGVNGAVIQTGWTPVSSPTGYPNATLIVDQEANVDSTSAGTATPLAAFFQVNNNGNTVSHSTIGIISETNNNGSAPEFENISLLLQPENLGLGTITAAYGSQSSCYNFGAGTITSCSSYAAYPPTNTGGGVVTGWSAFYVSGWNGPTYGTLPVNATGFGLDPTSALTASGTAYGLRLGQVTAPTAYEIYVNGTSPTLFTGGLFDTSGETQFKLPVHAGYASAANGEIGYDTTNLNWHAWLNGADNFIAGFPVGSPPTSGHVAGFLKSTNSWSLQDLGAVGTAANNLLQLDSGASIPTGVTAHTQTTSDTSADVATDAFVHNALSALAYSPPVSVISTSGSPYTLSGSAGFYWNNTGSAFNWVLNTPTVGTQYCFGNYVGQTGILTITSTTSVYIVYKGVNGTMTTGTLVSGGAIGDQVCMVGIDSTHYMVIGAGQGSWTNN